MSAMNTTVPEPSWSAWAPRTSSATCCPTRAASTPVSALSATAPVTFFFIHYATIGSPCTKSCAHHHQLTQNLLDLISERALNLSRRVEVLSQRTIRERLICYFMQLAAQAKASSFSLPFTMVDLADYLSIDRSAMTRELKRMKEEGLIEMDKRCVRPIPFSLSSNCRALMGRPK